MLSSEGMDLVTLCLLATFQTIIASNPRIDGDRHVTYPAPRFPTFLLSDEQPVDTYNQAPDQEPNVDQFTGTDLLRGVCESYLFWYIFPFNTIFVAIGFTSPALRPKLVPMASGMPK
jgi:hypothetical protein